jgi:intracellular septation protein A
MLPLIIFIGLMISRVYEVPMLHEGIVSMLLFSFVINPIKVIMSNERENPIRWALAPFADRIKKMIWIKVNLPLILITSLTLIYFGHSHFLWLGSNLIIITFAIVATMDDWLGQKPLLSGILHNILPILCLSSQLLW